MQPIAHYSPTPPGAPTKSKEARDDARFNLLFERSLDLNNHMGALFQTAAANINAATVGPAFPR
jgi:hypothetical protein